MIGCEIVFCYRTLPNPANWLDCEIVFCYRTLPNPANWLVAKLFSVIEPYQTLQIDCCEIVFVTEPYQTLQIAWLRNCFLLSNLTKPCKLLGCEIVFVTEPYQTLQIDWIAKLFFVIEPYQTLQIDWKVRLQKTISQPINLQGSVIFGYKKQFRNRSICRVW